jgi:hypothetical protein
MAINGWRRSYYRIFKVALDELEAQVVKLAVNDPDGYRTHPKTRLLASIYHAAPNSCPPTRMRRSSGWAKPWARITRTGGG